MVLHHVALENYNLLFCLGYTGTGAGMVLFTVLAEFLGEAYDWRGGLLIVSALMANIIPVGMAIQSTSNESTLQRNGFQSVPSSPPGFNREEESNSSTSQDMGGEFKRKLLLDRHCRSREPSTRCKKAKKTSTSVLWPFGLLGIWPCRQFARRFD